MELTPRERDKSLVFTAALLADRRMARGVKLNYPEAVAYLSAAILEETRDGRTVAELMSHGATLLTRDDRALGFRLYIPASTAVRFEPGHARTVEIGELADLALWKPAVFCQASHGPQGRNVRRGGDGRSQRLHPGHGMVAR
jgi:urease subunit gamma